VTSLMTFKIDSCGRRYLLCVKQVDEYQEEQEIADLSLDVDP